MRCRKKRQLMKAIPTRTRFDSTIVQPGYLLINTVCSQMERLRANSKLKKKNQCQCHQNNNSNDLSKYSITQIRFT